MKDYAYLRDYAYPLLMANQLFKQAHESGLKREFLEAGEKVAEAIVWLRQAKEAFLEHDEVERLWADRDRG